MVRINKDTGLLFPDGSLDELVQSVRDRLMTQLGTRLSRPNYGSDLGRRNPELGVVRDGALRILQADPLVQTVEFFERGYALVISVNRRVEVAL